MPYTLSRLLCSVQRRIVGKILILMLKFFIFPMLLYRVGRKYLNPWCGISTSWDMPIKICMAILIDKMQLSREFKGYRCNMKKIIEPSFSWFLYRFLVVCIWDFGLLKVKGHSHKMVKITKKFLQVLKIKISRKNFCLSNLFLMSLVILP